MRFILLAIGLLLTPSLWASSSLAATDQVTTGLPQAIAYLKTEGIRNVAVPVEVPKPTTSYFASAELKPNNVDYVLSFDNTAECHGAHYCNAGSLSTELQGNPTIYFDRDNHDITEKVILKNGHAVYYTPSHAMGSFWPGRVEWRCGTTLTVLSWTLPAADERTILLQMVDSMWGKTCQ